MTEIVKHYNLKDNKFVIDKTFIEVIKIHSSGHPDGQQKKKSFFFVLRPFRGKVSSNKNNENTGKTQNDRFFSKYLKKWSPCILNNSSVLPTQCKTSRL